jgi:hypothetical protein
MRIIHCDNCGDAIGYSRERGKFNESYVEIIARKCYTSEKNPYDDTPPSDEGAISMSLVLCMRCAEGHSLSKDF